MQNNIHEFLRASCSSRPYLTSNFREHSKHPYAVLTASASAGHHARTHTEESKARWNPRNHTCAWVSRCRRTASQPVCRSCFTLRQPRTARFRSRRRTAGTPESRVDKTTENAALVRYEKRSSEIPKPMQPAAEPFHRCRAPLSGPATRPPPGPARRGAGALPGAAAPLELTGSLRSRARRPEPPARRPPHAALTRPAPPGPGPARTPLVRSTSAWNALWLRVLPGAPRGAFPPPAEAPRRTQSPPGAETALTFWETQWQNPNEEHWLPRAAGDSTNRCTDCFPSASDVDGFISAIEEQINRTIPYPTRWCRKHKAHIILESRS